MFRISLLLTSVLMLSCAGKGHRHEQSFERDLDVHSLSNGLKVVLVEDHTTSVVSYQSWFRVGTIDEDKGVTGLAHLFEHLMFKGTSRYGPKEFFKQLEAKGADINAFTTRDYTAYYVNSVPSLLPKIIDMESDRLANLTVSDRELETEKQVVFEERRMRVESSPSGRMREALWQISYRVHPYRRPISGFMADLIRVETPQVETFFRKFYHPGNLTIVVVGDFDKENVLEMITKSYGAIQEREIPKREFPVEPPQVAERRLVLEDHVASGRFMHGYHVSKASEKDSYALDVLANILFHGTSSRAYLALVEKEELLASISGSAYTPTYPGLFMVSAITRDGVALETAESGLNRVIRRVQKEGVTSEEVATAVKQLIVQFYDNLRTPFGFGQLLGTVDMVLGDVRRYKEDIEKYREVKKEDVLRVAGNYLYPNNRNSVLLKKKVAKKK